MAPKVLAIGLLLALMIIVGCGDDSSPREYRQPSDYNQVEGGGGGCTQRALEISGRSDHTFSKGLSSGDRVSGYVQAPSDQGGSLRFEVTSPAGRTLVSRSITQGRTDYSFNADTEGFYVFHFRKEEFSMYVKNVIWEYCRN